MIAVFDSGLGGLWALRALKERLPKEDLLYFGDTARLPYGERSARTVRRFARQDISFLQKFSPRAILAACGTVSALALPGLQKECPIPLYGVVAPAVSEAVAQSRTHRIGVIGTRASMESGAYQDGIRHRCPDANVFAVACPLFVPYIESGMGENTPLAHQLCQEYLSPFLTWGIDTLLLGCTHYPLLKKAIAAVLPNVTLIDAGRVAADALCDALPDAPEESGKVRFCVSEDPQGFSARSAAFLEEQANPVFLV